MANDSLVEGLSLQDINESEIMDIVRYLRILNILITQSHIKFI